MVSLLSFALGYVVSARWIFPARDRTPSARLAEVPAVIGLQLEEARIRLGAEGLTAAASGRIHDSRREAGIVIAQSPLGGQLAASTDTVRLTVSAGPRSVELPALVGLSERQATRILSELGFTVRSTRVRSPVGGVEGTSPPAGELVSLPAEVELRVGEGPEAVVVPDLVGLHIDDVEALLRQYGLELGSVRFQADAPEARGRVIAQSPPAGYSTRGGSFVSVEVAGRGGAR